MKALGWGAMLGVSFGLASLPAVAVDFSASGFGTVGYARSNQAYTYQRFIDNDGTFWRDSVAGLQVDAKLADQWGATAQFIYAPSTKNDDVYTGTVSWAFLSWRPANDWLFRAGKQRIPIYLYSETVNVGVTYDFARLPTEMYSISANNDFTGLSFSKTWSVGNGDLALDGYWGKSKTDVRFWLRDNVPPFQTAGAVFLPVDVKGGGFVLTYKRDEDTYRIGAARAYLERRDGGLVWTSYPFVTLAPDVGYYQTDPSIPGPGIPGVDKLRATILSLGADVGLGSGFRFIGEFARTSVPDTSISFASNRGYVSLLKNVDQWTPYVLYAFLRSQSGERSLYDNVNYNTVPAFIPDAALINASQRSGADRTFTYDQSSWAVGTAYSFSATSKLKAEFMRTHVGEMSTLLDMPPGGNSRGQNVNVFSLSYSFVF
jgi:hypothetical protein